MTVRLIGGIALCLGASIAQPALAATACPTPKPPQVTVSTEMPPPVIDNSLTSPAIQAVAARKRPAEELLGLYSAKVDRHYDITFTVQRLGPEVCVAVERVPVAVRLLDRKIYVVRDRRPGTCAYDQVLNHERRHQAVDEEVVRAFVPKLLQQVQAAAVRARTEAAVPAARQTEALNEINALIGAAVDTVLREMLSERERREAQVDTPPEFARVRALCP